MKISWHEYFKISFLLMLIFSQCEAHQKAITQEDGEGSSGKEDSEGGLEMTKRNIGRWRNVNNRFQGKRSDDDFPDKKSLGRWRNRNWMTRINSGLNDLDTAKRDEVILENVDSDSYYPEDKRSLGRWRNLNYKIGRSNFREYVKRYLGRWRNRNYETMRKLQESKRNIGRWRNKNWLFSKRLP